MVSDCRGYEEREQIHGHSNRLPFLYKTRIRIVFMVMNNNRALHGMGVGLYMQEHAALIGLDPIDAFYVGWLHDAGYAFGDNRTHAELGGDALASLGFRYADVIRKHGTLAGLDTPMGVLLNIADMTIDGKGDTVGFDGRLADIANRYGETSSQYRNAAMVINALRDTEEYDLMTMHMQ